ncbi:alpha/beta fold hydrolase [Actinomycetospora sp. TBRC 11914]|uniref:alpha/beta fold hydrolase n=1 Tax=Actinomycetospora sp. TBRC 11914 TaxID=2729387 RepID=UPI00145FB9F0|nr:alpha/beta hydrolase [Actinomycetospora sp. TBRC 11914]NMO89188.1 alpha/beta hydrolase [Actinomycetospora sp. TBRC 11914]
MDTALRRPGRRERPVPGVVGDDGVPLDVSIRGSHGPTVVFCHGFTVDSGFWEPQIAALDGHARVVTWDQRGHGRSGWGEASHATVDQTGRDLAAVVDAVAPSSPVVLVGHSMGGMTILALARQRPEWFGTRVIGAFLVATSAGDLVRQGPVGLAHGLARRLGVLPAVMAGARAAAPLADLLPWRDSWVGRWTIRRLLFTAEATDEDVRGAQAVSERLPLPVGQAFGAALLDHDESAAVHVLARIPVVVVVATRDRLTPAAHGRRILDAIGPTARLVEVPDAAHAVSVTHHEVVDEALLDLVRGVRPRSAVGHGA